MRIAISFILLLYHLLKFNLLHLKYSTFLTKFPNLTLYLKHKNNIFKKLKTKYFKTKPKIFNIIYAFSQVAQKMKVWQ